jgi:hypothetical protein
MKESNMDKKDFIQIVLNEINHHNSIPGQKVSKRFYFRTLQLNFSKSSKKGIKYTKDYYGWISKKSCLITESPEKLYLFVRKKYGNIPLSYKNSTPSAIKMLSIQIMAKEIDYTKIPTIEEYYKTAKENEQRKITECLQKKLKLTKKDKIYFNDMIGENLPAGNLEETSGEAIISGKLYTYFWLEYSEKKGFYLDKLKPIKIIDLDEKE